MPGRTRRIKLTYLITDLKVGGVPLHLYRLATHLPRERFDLRVISLSDSGPVGARLREAGIAVDACGASTVRQLGSLARLWRLLVERPPDILHALLFHANIAARVVGPLAGVSCRRIINEIQTVEIERKWHLLVDGLTCRLCRVEVGNSPSVLQHLHRHAGIPESRLRCAWGAVDAGVIDTAPALSREALGVAQGQKLVVWTGRLDPVKGFEELLSACRMLRARCSLRLLLAGEGPYRHRIEELIRENGLQDTVVLLGQCEAIPSLLKTADLFVFPSKTEGLPNSLLEAMAAGLPIVTTDVPGCRDLVRHGETGLLVPPGSPHDLAGAMETLLSDEALGRRLGGNARKWVCEHADVRTWIQGWARFYCEFYWEPWGVTREDP